MATQDELNLMQSQVAQQAQQVAQAKQQVQAIRVAENPTMSELMGRGQTGALQARVQEQATAQFKAAQLEQVKKAESQVKANQDIVAQNVSAYQAFQKAQKAQEQAASEFQAGFALGKSGYGPSTISYSRGGPSLYQQGILAGQRQNQYYMAKADYLKQLKAPAPAPSILKPFSPPGATPAEITFQASLLPSLRNQPVQTFEGGYSSRAGPVPITYNIISPPSQQPIKTLPQQIGESTSGLLSYIKSTPLSKIASDELKLITTMWSKPQQALNVGFGATYQAGFQTPTTLSNSALSPKAAGVLMLPEKFIEGGIQGAGLLTERALKSIGGTGELAFNYNPLYPAGFSYLRPVIPGEENLFKNAPWNIFQSAKATNNQPITSTDRAIGNLVSTDRGNILSKNIGSIYTFLTPKEVKFSARNAVIGGLEVGTFLNPTTGAIRAVTYPLSIAGKSLSGQPVSIAELGTAGIMAAQDISKLTGTLGSMFFSSAQQEVPTAEQVKQVQPFSRQRATVLLKDESGNYILGKDPNTGIAFSFGGVVDKGETTRQAAIRELGEETGLKIGDVSGFKKAGTYVFPEETFNVYTATVKDISKIAPASDVSGGIAVFSPDNPFIKGVTGQTSFQPISRFTPLGNIRSYEAGIINALETGEPVTWLSVPTQYGKYYIGTQSRYDIPYSSQSQYLKSDILQLAHGTPSSEIASSISPFPREMTVKVGSSQRGTVPGLYVQPPISAQGEGGYIGLSYLGFKSPGSESLGPVIGVQRPTALLFNEPPTSPLEATPKTLAGTESEFIFSPGTTVSSVGRASSTFLGGQRVLLQPSVVVRGGEASFNVVPEVVQSSAGYYTYVSPSSITSSSLIASSSTNPLGLSVSKPSSSITSSVITSPSVSRIPLSKPLLSKSPFVVSAPSLPPSSFSLKSISSIASIPTSISEPSISQPSASTSLSPLQSESRSDSSFTYGLYGAASEKSKQKKSNSLFTRSSKAYQAYVRRKGKFFAVGKPTSRTRALSIGANVAEQTLARTFRVVPTSAETTASEITFKPSAKIFRSYQIRKGVKIPLKDQFIQRRSQSLGSRGERTEIKRARILKSSRGKVFTI